MHYILGHLAYTANSDKQQVKQNARRTFILALDGDIDFRPDALIHLTDLMKRSPTVAASCGRIHPNGSGFTAIASKVTLSITLNSIGIDINRHYVVWYDLIGALYDVHCSWTRSRDPAVTC